MRTQDTMEVPSFMLFERNALATTGFAPSHPWLILASPDQTFHADLDPHDRFSV